VAARQGTPLRAHFNELFTRAGLTPPQRPIECNSLIAARALLLESDRVMLLSAHQAHYELQAGLLAALPHPHGKVVRPIGLTMRRDWRPTTSQQRLLELLRKRALMQQTSPGMRPGTKVSQYQLT
jgi:DNA-binding transcriptional LysR family regulator